MEIALNYKPIGHSNNGSFGNGVKLFNSSHTVLVKAIRMKISEIYRMDIYSDDGQYVGDVQDVIIDLEKGEISRLLMTPWKNAKGDANLVLKKKSILYKSVKNIGDVVLVGGAASGSREEAASREEINDLSR